MKQVKEHKPDQHYFIAFNPEKFFRPKSLEMTISKIFNEQIDIQPFLDKMKNKERGQKEHHPLILLKIIFYSYTMGVFSSRKMEKNLTCNLSYIFLSSQTWIDHSTICRFINKYPDEITSVYSQILYICWKLNLINLDMIAVDGTKIRADVSKRFSGNRKQFETMKERLQRQIAKLLERQKRVDEKDASDEYRQDQKKKIDRQKQHYENTLEKVNSFLESVDDTKTIHNLTDPDCTRQRGENGKYFDGCWGKSKQTSKAFRIKKEVVENHDAVSAVKDKLESVEGRDIYHQRIGMIERVFALMKSILGFKRFYHRGLEKVSLIWTMLCTAYNIRKIYTYGCEV